MRVIIKENPEKCAEWAAAYIVKKINPNVKIETYMPQDIEGGEYGSV